MKPHAGDLCLKLFHCNGAAEYCTCPRCLGTECRCGTCAPTPPDLEERLRRILWRRIDELWDQRGINDVEMATRLGLLPVGLEVVRAKREFSMGLRIVEAMDFDVSLTVCLLEPE